jgi:hypothetical protein
MQLPRREIINGNLRCGRCKQWFPATIKFFRADKKRPQGLSSSCITCIKSQKLNPTETCVVCGKRFYASPGHTRVGWGKYCSFECRSKIMAGETHPRFKSVKEAIKICKCCGKQFRERPSRSYNHKGKIYCSRECYNKEHAIRVKKCKECGKDYEFYPSHEHNSSFCSTRCSGIYNFRKNGMVNKGTQRGKGGKRTDLNNQYFRSSWEANYARYLNFLVQQGKILKWEYEPDTFEFIKIKRGCRFYTPDFKIWALNGLIHYDEVKGWMDPKSITRHKRMNKYYPSISIRIIDKSWFRENSVILSKIIKYWE